MKLTAISKSFPGVKALDNVGLEIHKGKVSALIGENGAGKSTLMKILCGVYKKDSGEIIYKGEKIEISGPRHARELGISIIYQELNLIPYLSIAENIFLGREFKHKITGTIDWKKMYAETAAYLNRLGIKSSPKSLVKTLGIGEQQMVEIAKALSLESEIIIMDEPTASLSDTEIQRLFAIIKDLKQAHKAIIYISHKLEEVYAVCDDVVVLRDGKYIGRADVGDIRQSALIQMMVGRKIEDKYYRKEMAAGQEVLRVVNLNKKGLLQNINLTANKNEILAISGLMGSGRTELAKAIFGALKIDSGEIYVDGKKVSIRKPKDAVRAGITYASEDRKSEGLSLQLSLKHNMTLPSLKKFSRLNRIVKKRENAAVRQFIQKFKIKTPSPAQITEKLSGGNQQKVVIAKWLMVDPKVLILDEPTRGIDVGAKIEIYHLINELKESGVAVILISSEMPEVLGISDRIVVIHEGKITGEFMKSEATQEKIMHCAFGLA